MRQHRFWIEIVVVGTAVACAVALAVALLMGAVGAVGGVASGALEPPQAGSAPSGSGPEQTHEGMVSCSRCLARHSARLGKTAADCARTCVRDGAKFTLIEGDKAYQLEGDPAALRRIAGQRAGIVGVAAGNTIRVSTVNMPK